MRRTGTTRRSALTATGALALGTVLAGCGDGDGSGHDTGGATDARTVSAVRAEKALRTSAARTSLDLLVHYERVAVAHPATAGGLTPLRDAVRAHAKALSPAAEGPAATASSSTAPSPTGTADALRELAAAERRTSDAHTASLLKAPPELARLLASVAGASAAHAYLLSEMAKETSS